jgi:hypothetical protein
VLAVFFDEGFLGDKASVVCMLGAREKYGFERREISQALSASLKSFLVAHSSSGGSFLGT